MAHNAMSKMMIMIISRLANKWETFVHEMMLTIHTEWEREKLILLSSFVDSARKSRLLNFMEIQHENDFHVHSTYFRYLSLTMNKTHKNIFVF